MRKFLSDKKDWVLILVFHMLLVGIISLLMQTSSAYSWPHESSNQSLGISEEWIDSPAIGL